MSALAGDASCIVLLQGVNALAVSIQEIHEMHVDEERGIYMSLKRVKKSNMLCCRCFPLGNS